MTISNITFLKRKFGATGAFPWTRLCFALQELPRQAMKSMGIE
jgi:hypothetical protein